MGQRREPRLDINLPVRIFGTDSSGQIFSEKVSTVNVSRQGAELSGLKATPALEEIVGITYGAHKVHFRVKWVGQPDTPKASHVGLLNISPDKPLWDFPLPAADLDQFRRMASTNRRKYPRVKCITSVELHPEGETMIWGRATDLSLGGCYVEMGIPLKQSSRLRIGLWIKQAKLWVEGEVRSSTPGFGIGVKFTQISQEGLQTLSAYLAGLVADASR
jgi:hypothetical protein